MKLSNKSYDVLKWIAMYLLPAVGTLYFALAGIWGLPYGEQIVGTITAVDTFLGVLLGISSAKYNKKQHNERGRIIMKKFGIDISHWQGDFDFNKAISEGVEFVIIKGGGGDDGLYTDSKFSRNYPMAKSKGLPVGCYWFSKATSIERAREEAEYFYTNILKGRKFELPIYMDVEHEDQLKLDKKTLTSIVKVFLDYLERRGYWVGIYSTAYSFTAHLNDNELVRYAHWVAQWAKKCTYPHTECLGMWQFGGETNLIRTNKVAGVTCDQNYMLVDYPSLIKQNGLNGFTKEEVKTEPVKKEEPKPVLKTTAEIVAEVIAGKWGNGADRKKRLEAAGYNYTTIQDAVDTAMTKKPESKPVVETIKKGNKVKMSKDATIYGTKDRFADFVYKSTLYVRDLDGNRAVISTLKTGAVTGAVDKKYLTKI